MASIYKERFCKRCGHEWVNRLPRKPIRCPDCNSEKWDVDLNKKRKRK